jgi:hypothetical protein
MDVVKMLTATTTREVSLVRRGANKKRYAITKSESAMSVFEAVLKTAAEGEEQLVESLKSAGADQKRIDAAVAAFRVTKGFSDVITPEDAELIAKAAKGDEDDEDESDDLPAFMKGKKSKKTKKSAEPDLSALDPATRAQVESVFKSNQDLTAQIGQLTNVVKGLVDSGTKQQYVAKAASEYSHIPGTPDEIGAVLKSAHDASPELGAGIEKLLGMVNGLVQKSAMLGSVGTPGGAGAGGSAWSRIETMAGQLTLKSDSGVEMSKEQKVAHVIAKTAEGRQLYREYLAENPAQRAKHNFG